ncbi:hypothetical protein V8054_000571 [Vibrio parahaemolyticus]|uniref:hypothetical protein n=1 Tax=Vibrio sp. B1REV9 TaxID=2751179 RepID=UPI001AF429C1|nr:hypothetical protein [Vibrio sp. B1REV9]CAE6928695.1 hypothetical protein ACOMICROBIO_GDFFDHBD_02454 [Vibrio sp. B1REV9]
MALKGCESEMANNIMDAMEKAGLNPRNNAALGEVLWAAISEGIIKTINDKAEVEVTSGSSAGKYKVS